MDFSQFSPMSHANSLWRIFSRRECRLKDLAFNAILRTKISARIFHACLPFTHAFAEYRRILEILHDDGLYKIHYMYSECEQKLGNLLSEPSSNLRKTHMKRQLLQNIFGLSEHAIVNPDFVFKLCGSTSPRIFASTSSNVCNPCAYGYSGLQISCENIFQHNKFYSNICATNETSQTFKISRIIEFPKFGDDRNFYLQRGVKFTFCVKQHIGELQTHFHFTMELERIDETVNGGMDLRKKSSRYLGMIDVLQPLDLCGLHCIRELGTINLMYI